MNDVGDGVYMVNGEQDRQGPRIGNFQNRRGKE